MAKTNQRIEDNGIENRKLLNPQQILQWFIIALLTGGVSIGGIKFVSQDSADVKQKVASVEQQLNAHIEQSKAVEELKSKNIQLKINNIEKEVSAIRNDQKDIKRVLQQILLNVRDKK